MKNQKRTVGIIMALVMLLTMIAPAVQATESIGNISATETLLPSTTAIHSFKGLEVPKELKDGLEEFGISANLNTLVEIMPYSCENDNPILVVTELEENTISKSAFMMMNNNGEVQPIVSLKSLSTRASDGSEIRLNPLQDSFVLRICTQYNIYSNPWYQWSFIQPNAVMFILYDDDNLYSISNVELDYWCVGARYSYPGMTYVDENGDHSITLRVATPTERMFYNANNPYSSNYVINVMQGPYAGHMVDYSFVANGRAVSGRWEVMD